MSEYPEHIDQIDDYYRSQLADHEIEPPEGLWSKISVGALETKAPDVKATVVRFTNAQKYLGLLAGSIIIIVGCYYFYASKQNVKVEEDTVPLIEQPVKQIHEYDSPANQKENTPSANPLKNNTSTIDSLHKKGEEVITSPNEIEEQADETKVAVPLINTSEIEKLKADSIAEIKTAQKKPKEKVKFKDKLKKEYQDSTHKLFVPGK